jgi:hypothetical protein
MPDIQITFNVPQEIQTVGQCLVTLVTAVKAKQPILQIAESDLAQLVAAVEALSAIPADIKAEPANSVMYAGFLGGQVVAALL